MGIFTKDKVIMDDNDSKKGEGPPPEDAPKNEGHTKVTQSITQAEADEAARLQRMKDNEPVKGDGSGQKESK